MIPRNIFLSLAGLVLAAAIAIAYSFLRQRPPQQPIQPTFTKDVAPIIFAHCAPCHRPNQSAPFPLLTYEDCQKRAQQIAEVTASRYMPPWLPQSPPHAFANERLLTPAQTNTLSQWALHGSPRGNPDDLPPLPQWPGEWQLGTPHAIVSLPVPFTLPAEGPDIYRNFVIPTSFPSPRFVRTIEFQPGNPKAIHHAVLLVDQTPLSRELDAQDPRPGFGGGMARGNAQIPEGHFLGWTPGKTPHPGHKNRAWTLHPNSDLVLQLHLRPTGKPEIIQPQIGLHFTDAPPSEPLYSLVLRSKTIEIPAGAPLHPIHAELEIPVDLLVLSVYPHAHFIAKTLTAAARLPDGRIQPVIHIPAWDFNWQDDYPLRQPLFLPKGTILFFDYIYDNSDSNPRNPFSPPKTIAYGQNSTDEMAELLLQVLPQNPADLDLLRRYSSYRAILEDLDVREKLAQKDPSNIDLRLRLGQRYQQIGQIDAALAHYQNALALDPQRAQAHFLVAEALAEKGEFTAALTRFQNARQLEPENPAILSSLSLLLAQHPDPSQRDPAEAIRLAADAARLTRFQQPLILENLARAHAAAGDIPQALKFGRDAIQAASQSADPALLQEMRERYDRFEKSLNPQ